MLRYLISLIYNSVAELRYNNNKYFISFLKTTLFRFADYIMLQIGSCQNKKNNKLSTQTPSHRSNK
ncbi:hypothetical protein DXC89_10800 [Prevotella disiens]|uniref:Uncharacterized protein n=1 Tax=Prevotella disiens TaxID=28130 RepID=A0A3E4QCT9_9BACT|nr:hypothetical protein DXC89_10800 [Prevotella disiens]